MCKAWVEILTYAADQTEALRAFSIENRVRVRGTFATGGPGWDPPGARCLWICTLVIDTFSWEWWVKKRGLFYETTEGARKRVAAEETTHRASRAALPAHALRFPIEL